MTYVKYLLHDGDGNVRQWGRCPRDLLQRQARDDLAVLEYDWADGFDPASILIGPGGAVLPQSPASASN